MESRDLCKRVKMMDVAGSLLLVNPILRQPIEMKHWGSHIISADQWDVGTYMGDDDGCCWVPAAGHHGPVVAPVPDTVDTVTVKSLNHKYTVHRIL